MKRIHTLMYTQVLHQMTVCTVLYTINMKREKLSIDRTERGGRRKGRGRDERVGKKQAKNEPRVEVGIIVLVGMKKKTQVGLVGM